MDTYDKLQRRLADITNLDIEHIGRSKDSHPLKAQSLTRVVLTASGFHGAAKQELQRLASSIGATYSGDLVQGVTTHLICKRLIDCFGSIKYQRALEWGIHIVTYEWLEASSAAGRPLPEQDYKDDKLQALKPSPRPVRRCQQVVQQVQQQPQPAEQCTGATAHAKDCPPAAVPVLPTVAAVSERVGQSAADVADQEHHCNIHSTPAQAAPQQQKVQGFGLQPAHRGRPPHLKLSLDDLPQDFLLQGSEPEEETAAADGVDGDAGIGLSLSLSQYSLQQHREREQEQTCVVMPGAAEPSFGFLRPPTPASAEPASPCMQHFLPMHQQQQGCPSGTQQAVDSCGGTGSEIHAVGISAAPAAATKAAMDGAAAQLVETIGSLCSPAVVPGQYAFAVAGASSAAAGPPMSPASPISSEVSADDQSAGKSMRLHLPETQAELEDPWGTAAAAGDTPVSLKYYAQQLRSRTRTAGGAESTCCRQLVQQDLLQQSVQQQQQPAEGHQDLEADEAADETADDTEEPNGSSSELDLDQDHVAQQQRQQRSAARPCSASSSTACSQQQQQPDFRLTQPSSSGGSSRRSSGLTRLKRRDGFRRLGRVLVSQLPDPSALGPQDSSCEVAGNDCELQDSDCELPDSDCELSDSDCEVFQDGLGDAILDDSDCDDMQQQALHHAKGGAAAVNRRHRNPTAAPHSPVDSCSASSLPAHSDGRARRTASSSRHPCSPTASAAATTPAASAVSGSSTGEMPVMQLQYSLSDATQRTPGAREQDSSVYTPSCSYVSSEYSPLATTGPVGASSRVGEHSSGLAGCVEVDEGDYAPQQQMQQQDHGPAVNEEQDRACAASAAAGSKQQQLHEGDHEPGATSGRGSPSLSDPSSFITRRRGGRGPATLQQHKPNSPQAAAAAAHEQVSIKQEPEQTGSEGWLLQQQRDAQQHLAAAFNPADAMIRAMKQRQQQQQQQRPVLKPAPIKQEKLTPAEHLLQDLRMRQQQQQQHRQQPAAIDPATEGIDDEADSQGLATHRALQQHKLSRNSVASCATDISTASRKVPLKVLGVAEKVIGGDSTVADGAAGSTTPLERLLQATLVARRESDAAVAGDVPVKQEAAEWVHTPEGDGAKTAAGTAAAGGGGCDSEADAFEITELPTGVVAARNKAMTKQLGAHLAHLSQAGADQVIPLKLLSKAPRGSTAKAFHGIKSNSKLVYADQVQVPWAHATLSTKEKSRCVIVADGPNAAPGLTVGPAADNADRAKQDKVLLAEPVAFYQLESGEWWLELLRFYSTKELRLLAKAADCKLHLPADYHLSYELLRGMNHEHVPMKLVQGEFKLSKVKKVPSGSRSRANPFFWRYSIDLATMQVLTDRPVTDYIMQ